MVLLAFVSNTCLPSVYAQQIFSLPAPGVMVPMSAGYVPTLIRGITVHPENPLQYDFIIDTGNSKIEGQDLVDESNKLIKYFLASLTVPENELWVNLSPYEKDRIAADSFGRTEMGRDLLGQDYILKQLTATLTDPQTQLGKKYWSEVERRTPDAGRSTFDVPRSTFNKIWIVPQEAQVYEQGTSAFVVKSRLKVMLEEDYLALNVERRTSNEKEQTADVQRQTSSVSSEVLRELILPEIEKEVNEGKNFAPLRQIYNSMILAAWFKNNLRESLLGRVYVDKNKVLGVDVDDPTVKEKIYQQYLEAYKKGVYSYIKEEVDPVSEEMIPRKYFSGGFMGDNLQARVAGSTVRGTSAGREVKQVGKVFKAKTAISESIALAKQFAIAAALGVTLSFSPTAAGHGIGNFGDATLQDRLRAANPDKYLSPEETQKVLNAFKTAIGAYNSTLPVLNNSQPASEQVQSTLKILGAALKEFQEVVGALKSKIAQPIPPSDRQEIRTINAQSGLGDKAGDPTYQDFLAPVERMIISAMEKLGMPRETISQVLAEPAYARDTLKKFVDNFIIMSYAFQTAESQAAAGNAEASRASFAKLAKDINDALLEFKRIPFPANTVIPRGTMPPPKGVSLPDSITPTIILEHLQKLKSQVDAKTASSAGVEGAETAPSSAELTSSQTVSSEELGSKADQKSDAGAKNVGGINLDPKLLNLQIKRDENGVPLPLIQQPINDMNIEGFYPVIINITPISNLPMLLSSSK